MKRDISVASAWATSELIVGVAIAVTNEEEWKNLCCVMEHPAWTKDPKFSTLLSRKKNEEELDRLIGE